MMLLAGASRAVVPVPGPLAAPDAAARGAAPAAPAPLAAAPSAAAAPPAGAAAELEAPLELPAEHPARNMAPPSRTLPVSRPAIVRPATVPGRGGPDRVPRRAGFRVFSMPMGRLRETARFGRDGHDRVASRPRPGHGSVLPPAAWARAPLVKRSRQC